MEAGIIVQPVFEDDISNDSAKYSDHNDNNTDPGVYEMKPTLSRNIDQIVLNHVEELIKSNPEFSHLAIVRRTTEQYDFLQVFDRTSDCGHFNNLQLVLRCQGDLISLKLFSEGQELVRETSVKHNNIIQNKNNPNTPAKSLIHTYLRELRAGLYEVCPGAVDESAFLFDLSNIDLKEVLIEKVSGKSPGSVVFRSRNCTHLNKNGTGPCLSCSDLRLSLQASGVDETANNDRSDSDDGYEGANGHHDFDESHSNISQYLEVSIDDEANRNTIPSHIKEEPMETDFHGLSERFMRANGDHTVFSSDNQLPNPEKRPPGSYVLNKKTKLSYKELIMMAINDSQFRMLKLTDIYSWILDRYPSFANNRTGFQNSIRHNLSLNKIFMRVGSEQGTSPKMEGKGGYWTINPKFEQLLKLNPKQNFLNRPTNATLLSTRSPSLTLPPSTLLYPIDPSSSATLSLKSSLTHNPSNSLDNSLEISKTTESSIYYDKPEGSVNLGSETSLTLTNIKHEHDYQDPNQAEEDLSKHSIDVKSDVTKQSSPPNENAFPVNLGFGEGGEVTKSSQEVTLNPRSSDQTARDLLLRLKYSRCPKPSPGPVQLKDSEGYFTVHKPNFSYKELIMLAIYCSSSQHLGVCLNDIYLTIKHWFPYFQQKDLGSTWQNSVRHNLSLNKCFHRIELQPTERYNSPGTHLPSKGGYWMFEQNNETWTNLMAQPRKWFEYRKDNSCKTTEKLIDFLKERNSVFREKVYNRLTPQSESKDIILSDPFKGYYDEMTESGDISNALEYAGGINNEGVTTS